MDATLVTVAVVGAVAPTIASLAAVITARAASHRTAQSVEAVHDEIRTNHGLRAGDYLERIGDIQADQVFLHAQIAGVGRQFEAHARDDEERFRELYELLTPAPTERATKHAAQALGAALEGLEEPPS